MILLGQFVNNKEQAKALVNRFSSRFDGSMESSVAISTIEEMLVQAGFLTWEEVEAAEAF